MLQLATTGYREPRLLRELSALLALELLLLDLGVRVGLGMDRPPRLPPLATPLMTLETATDGPTLVVELAHLRLPSLLEVQLVIQLP